MPSSLTLTGGDALGVAFDVLEAGELEAVGLGVLLVALLGGTWF
jgi:hypothetical protein